MVGVEGQWRLRDVESTVAVRALASLSPFLAASHCRSCACDSVVLWLSGDESGRYEKKVLPWS